MFQQNSEEEPRKYKFPGDVVALADPSKKIDDRFGKMWLKGAGKLTALKREDIFEVDKLLSTIDSQPKEELGYGDGLY